MPVGLLAKNNPYLKQALKCQLGETENSPKSKTLLSSLTVLIGMFIFVQDKARF
jgi:hypothetical protein